MELQSIEDFMKEQDAIDAEKARTDVTMHAQLLPKKPKRTIDAEAVTAEQRAKEEIGNENWVGKLLGLSISKAPGLPSHLLIRFRVSQRTSSHRDIQSTIENTTRTNV
jgi:hypothetical protein